MICNETRRVDVRRPDGGSIARTEPSRIGDRLNNVPSVRGPNLNDDLVEIAGVLLAPPARLGTANAIRPPTVTIPEASLNVGLGSKSSVGSPSSPVPSAPLDATATASPDGKFKAGLSLVRMLPGKVSGVTSAGNGRYLLLSLRESRQLAIFDANVADVTRIIPLPHENVLVAGGSEKFVLVFPDQMIIERWDLTNVVREESRTSPIRAKIVAIAMGSDTAGPILAEWLTDQPPQFGPQERCSFIDPVSLKVLKVPKLTNTRTRGLDTLSTGGGVILFSGAISSQIPSISAANDGSVFIVRDRMSPDHCRTLELADGMVRTRFFTNPSGSRLAGPDGRLLFSSFRVHDSEGKLVFKLPDAPYNSIIYLPSADAGYFLGIAGLSWMPSWMAVQTSKQPIHSPLRMTVFAAGSLIPLVTVECLDEMDQLNPINDEKWERMDPPFEQHFDWIPLAELLVTIPASNDRLCLRRFSMPRVLAKLGGDFLYVTSADVLRVPAGKKLNHRIEVRARRGGVKLTLTKAPDGLTLKPDSLIEWNVPDRGVEFEETAVITIEDASGQSLFHRLKIHVR